MGGKSQPDFGAIATSQGEENREVVQDQIKANRPNQYTPWGYTNWTQDDDGYWSQTTGLSTELQDIYNKQTAIQGGKADVAGSMIGRMGQEFANPMDWSGLNPMGQVPTAQYTLPEGDIGDPYGTRQRAEDAVYNQAQSRIQPQQESQRAALEIKMRNQGLTPGDAAWQSQMQSQGNQFNDQNNQALWSASGAGRQEAGQMWGMGKDQNQNNFNQALQANNQNYNQSMQNSAYANQIRQQQLTEQMQKRGFSLNEINAIQSGQQVGMPSMPNFSNAGQAQPAPYMQGAAQDASAANAANPLNALIGAAGAAGAGYLSTL